MTSSDIEGRARLAPLYGLLLTLFLTELAFAPGKGRMFSWLPLTPLIIDAVNCPPDEHFPLSHTDSIIFHGAGNWWSVGVWMLLAGAVVALLWWPLIARRMAQVGLVIGSVSLSVSTTRWLEPALLSGEVPASVSCNFTSSDLAGPAALRDYERAILPVMVLMVFTAFLSLFDSDSLRSNLRWPIASYRTRWIIALLFAVVTLLPYILVVIWLWSDQTEGQALWWLLLPIFPALAATPLSFALHRSYRRIGVAAGLASLTIVFGHWTSLGSILLSHTQLEGSRYEPRQVFTLTQTQHDLLDAERAALLVLMFFLMMLLLCSALVNKLLLQRLPPQAPAVVLLQARIGRTTDWVDVQQQLWTLGCFTVTREGHARHLAQRGAQVFELDLTLPAHVQLRALGLSEAEDRTVAVIRRDKPPEELWRDLANHLSDQGERR